VRLDHIEVSQVDWAIGVLRGVLGTTIVPELADKIETAIPHVRAAARHVERSQRVASPKTRRRSR
jgi:hypothetical protein